MSDYKIEPEEKDPIARAWEADALQCVFVIIDDAFRAVSDYRSGYGLLSYHGESDTVVIPDVINRIDSRAFENNATIRKVIIPQSVGTTGFDVFRGCYNLQEVALSASLVKLSAGLFEECKNLKSIVIPDSIEEIGDYAFFRSGLESIVIPNSVRQLGKWVFSECPRLANCGGR